MWVCGPGSNPGIVCFFFFFFFCIFRLEWVQCVTQHGGLLFLSSVIKHRMADVPFTVIALKASLRKHNKTNTVRLTQRIANLIADMRKKKVAFPRDPSKQSKSKSVAAPRRRQRNGGLCPHRSRRSMREVLACKVD